MYLRRSRCHSNIVGACFPTLSSRHIRRGGRSIRSTGSCEELLEMRSEASEAGARTARPTCAPVTSAATATTSPPFIISEAEIAIIVAALDDALFEITQAAALLEGYQPSRIMRL